MTGFTYETGWDDKNSPFVDLKGHLTSAINEQGFNLWNLQEMIYLSRLQREDPSPWQQEFSQALAAARCQVVGFRIPTLLGPRHRNWKALDTSRNLDAYYLLYFEKDPLRVDAMMQRLNDPEVQRCAPPHNGVRYTQLGRLLAWAGMA